MAILDSLTKAENAAAICSALAALGSAVAAYLSWRAQVLTLRHTFRPELVISDWKRIRRDDLPSDLLIFGRITNIGRDSAKTIVINAFAFADDRRPLYSMGTLDIPHLAPNETAIVNGEINLFLKNAPMNLGDHKLIAVEIRILCWDALNVRHDTTVSLSIYSDPTRILHGSAQIASGTFLQGHRTQSTPVWRLKLGQAMRGIPLLTRKPKDARHDP